MKLLITGAFNCTENQKKSIADLGFEILFHKMENEPLIDEMYEVEAIICNGLFLHNDVEKFSNLKYVQLTSAGLDRVPVEKMQEKGIILKNARGVYSVPMAEFALCGVLELYKKSRFFYDKQKQKAWVKNREIMELYGKNVLVVGSGSVGTECAKRFNAFGTHVRGVDLYPRQDDNYEIISPLTELTVEISFADIVVLTLPLTEETKHLFDKTMFSYMKKDAVLVNIARGAVVDTEALVDALSSQKLYGAVLDVFENEPLEEASPLWNMQNVILTPHNSFIGNGNGDRLFDVVKSNLEGIAV